MIIHGLKTIELELANIGYFFKAITNDTEIAFFPGSIQHRDMKISGLSYEDDYLGNALACIIKPNQIEVRYHGRYTDAMVERIFRNILGMPEASALSKFSMTYQGRQLL
ncbi:MAG: hypothetical protein ACSHX0_13425 [Akkermansiaceae bacterium]